jgi:hypothetical protein
MATDVAVVEEGFGDALKEGRDWGCLAGIRQRIRTRLTRRIL